MSATPRAKILIVRLSAMGDIILTTPAVRALRRAQPEAELHYLTKSRFAESIRHNPHLDRVIEWEGKDFNSLVTQLKAESYTHVVDLHKNLRSNWLRFRLGVPATTFHKANTLKNRMVWFKDPKLAVSHIVERYMQAVAPWGAVPDEEGLEFPLLPEVQHAVEQNHLDWNLGAGYVALVLSATWFTKRWPEEHVRQFVQNSPLPVVLLGGPAESEIARRIVMDLPPGQVHNLAGKTSLQHSAAWLERAEWVLTGDTGLMHIAAALHKPTVVLWGNTTPRFGMSPYRTEHLNLEIEGLGCRPCSRIGYQKCPKGHFKCMRLLAPEQVQRQADQFRAQLNRDS